MAHSPIVQFTRFNRTLLIGLLAGILVTCLPHQLAVAQRVRLGLQGGSAAAVALPQPPVVAAPLAAAPTPVPACTESEGRVESGSLQSSVSASWLDYRIYLPPCYDPTAAPGYPVLYMLHGMGSTDDQWERMGITASANRLIAAGELPPFLIVMPYDRAATNMPEADPFGAALVQDLVPWIDRHYDTRPQARYRAIGGLSRGAGWAFHLGLADWQVFGAIGGHSLPLFWQDGGHLPEILAAIPRESLPRIFLDIGRSDPEYQTVRALEQFLTDRSIPHEWHEFLGYHDEKYWSAHLEQYLRWYAAGWVD